MPVLRSIRSDALGRNYRFPRSLPDASSPPNGGDHGGSVNSTDLSSGGNPQDSANQTQPGLSGAFLRSARADAGGKPHQARGQRRAHHRQFEALLEGIDGLYVVGAGDQALDQPLPGVPILDFIRQDQA